MQVWLCRGRRPGMSAWARGSKAEGASEWRETAWNPSLVHDERGCK